MKKIKTFAGMYFFGLLLCGVLAVITLFVGVKPMLHVNKILTNGTQAQATVIELIKSNTVINSKHTYNLLVKFNDRDGNTVQAKSLDFLSLDDSQAIQDRLDVGETVIITIRYIGKEIIVGNSIFSTTGVSNIIFSVACVVMTLLTIFLLFFLIKTCLQASSMNKALQNGDSIQGYYVETSKPMTMGNTKYFGITYKYNDLNGDSKTVKSPKNYTHDEAEKLRQVKTFDVKVEGKVSIIAFDFDNNESSETRQENSKTTF